MIVDTDGLAADGAALAARQAIDAAPACEPAGADIVSVAVAAQLSAHLTSAALLINHAQQLRAAGGAVTQHTAASLRAVDEAAAAVIAGTTMSMSMSEAASGLAATSSALPAPVLPAIPSMPPAATATGEAQATALYSGPGAASLRQLGIDWQSWATTLDDVAGETSQTAASIDAHWSDGIQQAGAATAAHGSWLSGMAAQVRALASAADEVADHYDQAIAATPSPQEFTDAHTQLAQLTAANSANHGLLSSQVSAAAAALAQLQSQATEAAHAYYTAAATTMSAIDKTSTSAPSIASGGSSAAASTPSSRGAATKTGGAKSTAKTTRAASSAQSTSSTDKATGTSTGSPATDLSTAVTNAGTAITNAAANSSQMQQAATTLLPAAAMLPMAPMSALSGLSGLSRSSAPTSAAEFAGQSGAAPDPDTASDLGDPAADTSPASSGGVSAEADKGAMPAPSPPRSSPSPHSPGSGPATIVGLAAADGAATAPAAAEGSGTSSYPPMMGAPGAGEGGGQRDLRLFPDRRLVARQVPNSEAVFGELQRERRSRIKRASPEQGQATPGEGTDER